MNTIWYKCKSGTSDGHSLVSVNVYERFFPTPLVEEEVCPHLYLMTLQHTHLQLQVENIAASTHIFVFLQTRIFLDVFDSRYCSSTGPSSYTRPRGSQSLRSSSVLHNVIIHRRGYDHKISCDSKHLPSVHRTPASERLRPPGRRLLRSFGTPVRTSLDTPDIWITNYATHRGLIKRLIAGIQLLQNIFYNVG